MGSPTAWQIVCISLKASKLKKPSNTEAFMWNLVSQNKKKKNLLSEENIYLFIFVFAFF